MFDVGFYQLHEMRLELPIASSGRELKLPHILLHSRQHMVEMIRSLIQTFEEGGAVTNKVCGHCEDCNGVRLVLITIRLGVEIWPFNLRRKVWVFFGVRQSLNSSYSLVREGVPRPQTAHKHLHMVDIPDSLIILSEYSILNYTHSLDSNSFSTNFQTKRHGDAVTQKFTIKYY